MTNYLDGIISTNLPRASLRNGFNASLFLWIGAVLTFWLSIGIDQNSINFNSMLVRGVAISNGLNATVFGSVMALSTYLSMSLASKVLAFSFDSFPNIISFGMWTIFVPIFTLWLVPVAPEFLTVIVVEAILAECFLAIHCIKMALPTIERL